jgi:hypothetical protein
MPKNPTEHLQGTRSIDYTDPKTGVTSKAPEMADELFVKPNLVTTEKTADEKRHEAQALVEVRNYVDGIDKLTGEAVDIISQLKDKTIFKDLLINSIKGINSSGILSHVSQNVMINGKKENAGIALNNITGHLATEFAKAEKLGQLDTAAQRIINQMVGNPESSFTSARDSIDQFLRFRNTAQEKLIKNAENKGFIADYWKKRFNEENQEVNAKLNKKEEAKENAKRKQKGSREFE